MMPLISEPAIARLASILEQELLLLRSGRAGEVASLIEDKMIALQEFEAHLRANGMSKIDPDQLRAIEQVIRMAEENAAHMDAVRNGVGHAIRRLEALNSSALVGSYGFGGSRISFTNATGAFSRKV